MMPKLLTPLEVAAVLQVSYEVALAFIKYSGIDYVRVGRQYRVAEDKLRDFLHKKGSTTIDISGI